MSATATSETADQPGRARPLLMLLASGLALALIGEPVWAAWDLNMPRGVTQISREAYDQHMLMLYWCIGIGVVVFGVMFYSIWRHRKAAAAEPAQFHHSTLAEVVWTVVPCLILISMAIPATKALIVMEDTTTDAEMTVKVTGYQWKWRYDYVEDGVSFYSNLAPSSREVVFGDPSANEHYLREVDNPVVLPVGKKVRILLTADDVIHAWWVPALGQKKDAIPGFINEIWARIEEPGIYRGQCAELCGKDHGFMPIVVDARPQAEYEQWVADQKKGAQAATQEAARDWSKDELMDRGREVYTTVCAACHQPGGQGAPPAFPPISGSPVATGPIDAHLDLVLNGKPGTVMQAFRSQLGDAEIAAVITYQRNALGNSVGDFIQPAEVKTARN